MSFYSDLLGTLRTTFRIGPKSAPATLNASSLTAPRTHTLQDRSGVLAQLEDIRIYVGPESSAPSGVTAPTLMILRETGADSGETSVVVREP